MTYAEPLSNQVLMFIRSIGPGVLIGLIYDIIFSFFRSFSDRRAVIITADLTFSIIATMISFFYMIIYNSGTVRLNIIIAQAIGAVAIHITIGKYVAKLVGYVGNILGKILGYIFSPLVFIFGKIKSLLKKIPKLEVNDKLHTKKILNILKIYLKN